MHAKSLFLALSGINEEYNVKIQCIIFDLKLHENIEMMIVLKRPPKGAVEGSVESLGVNGITSCNGYRSSNFYPRQITSLALTS